MASKSGKTRRRNQIRQRQKRREKHRKWAKRLGVSLDELSRMIERHEISNKKTVEMLSRASQ